MRSNIAGAPIELRGNWYRASEPAQTVIIRMREVALEGITLCSDRQPRRIFVDNHDSGPPSIWLHSRPAKTAWIITDVGERDWCRLAYQFGHELGHVLANSWQSDAAPRPPCQWLEEVLAESFSLRSLKLLADSWAHDPPLGNADFGRSITSYRRAALSPYRANGKAFHVSDLEGLLDAHGSALADSNGFSPIASAAVPILVRRLEQEPTLIEDYGALNRWPERSAVPLPEYIARWLGSCRQIDAPGRLPSWLARQFAISI